MSKILISGYYGYDNLGDEAVLETILKNIKKAVVRADITVLSSDPEATIAKYHVHSVGRSSFWKVFKELLKCDLLISGGGSLLQDVTSRLSIFYYLLIILAGRLLGKKVMVYSQGIGPIHKPFNRKLTKWILSGVEAITVRESYSKKDLIEMGVAETLIEVTADPVVSMELESAADGKALLSHYMTEEQLKKPKIGFALRGKAYTKALENRILETVKGIQKEMDVTFVFIPFYFNEDIQAIDALKKVLDGNVVFLDQRHEAREILGITRELDVLVGERLHSLIFAGICHIPMIALSYDPKIEYFMETIESKTEFHIQDFDPSALKDKIKNTYEASEVLKHKLQVNMQALQMKLDKNEAIITHLLNQSQTSNVPVNGELNKR